MKLADRRLLLGPTAVLSIETAATLLPIRDADARRLIEQAGIIRDLDGKRVVLWGDCAELAELRSTRPARRRSPRPKV